MEANQNQTLPSSEIEGFTFNPTTGAMQPSVLFDAHGNAVADYAPETDSYVLRSEEVTDEVETGAFVSGRTARGLLFANVLRADFEDWRDDEDVDLYRGHDEILPPLDPEAIDAFVRTGDRPSADWRIEEVDAGRARIFHAGMPVGEIVLNRASLDEHSGERREYHTEAVEDRASHSYDADALADRARGYATSIGSSSNRIESPRREDPVVGSATISGER